MRYNFVFIGLILFVSIFPGCTKKVSVPAQVTELEKAFPAPTASSAEISGLVTSEPQTVNAYVKEALVAVQANDYVKGVVALQTAQTARGTTVEQFKVIEKTKMTIMTDLINRADRGDAKAKADLAAIGRTH